MSDKVVTIKQLEKVIKASADANRLRIINMLLKKPMCVCEIAFVLGITQPSVSRHLKKLKDAGFIDRETDGLWTNYFIKPKNDYVKHLLNCLPKWLHADSISDVDSEKLDTANRNKLCSS